MKFNQYHCCIAKRYALLVKNWKENANFASQNTPIAYINLEFGL